MTKAVGAPGKAPAKRAARREPAIEQVPGAPAEDAVATGVGPGEEAMPTDGRAARAVRTRTQIVDALLSLLEEGDLQPPANRIAERAGISLRLIYHHFGDLESLFRATASREAERLAARSTPVDYSLPLPERIDALVESRTRMLEWLTPVRRAALLQEPFSAELQSARKRFVDLAELEVRHAFATELAAMPEDRREVVVSSVHGVLLWGHWNDLRNAGRDEDQARAAVRAIVRSLLL